MSMERPPAANDNRESGERSVAEVNARLRELLGSLAEAVSELPQVLVNGEVYEFSPDKEPELVTLAEVQVFLNALDQELAKLAEQGAAGDAVKERAFGHALEVARSIETILKHRADVVAEAQKRGEAGDEYVRTFDRISEHFLAPANENNQDRFVA